MAISFDWSDESYTLPAKATDINYNFLKKAYWDNPADTSPWSPAVAREGNAPSSDMQLIEVMRNVFEAGVLAGKKDAPIIGRMAREAVFEARFEWVLELGSLLKEEEAFVRSIRTILFRNDFTAADKALVDGLFDRLFGLHSLNSTETLKLREIRDLVDSIVA